MRWRIRPAPAVRKPALVLDTLLPAPLVCCEVHLKSDQEQLPFPVHQGRRLKAECLPKSVPARLKEPTDRLTPIRPAVHPPWLPGNATSPPDTVPVEQRSLQLLRLHKRYYD